VKVAQAVGKACHDLGKLLSTCDGDEVNADVNSNN
jgi:hypothetical protein